MLPASARRVAFARHALLLAAPSFCFALQGRRLASAASSLPQNKSQPEHLVVLIHGLAGTHEDLGYLAQSIREAGGEEVHCHAVAANAGMRTVDGVVKGGNRACDEVRLVVQQYPSLRRISVVGNSLGGIYARYMVAQLRDAAPDGAMTFCGMAPVAFVTIASPHLGIANLTYWPLPDALEQSFATLFQETGGDLFRRDADSLMKQLATRDKYLAPLAAFERRRVYGNLRGDFLVVPESALFMPNSDTIKLWRKYAVLTHKAMKHKDPAGAAKELGALDGDTQDTGESEGQTNRGPMSPLADMMRYISNLRSMSLSEGLEAFVRHEESLGRIVAVFDSRTSQAPNPEMLKNPRRISAIARLLKSIEEGDGLPPELRKRVGQPLRALQQLQLPQLELPGADGMVLPTIPSARASKDTELQEMATALDELGWSKVLVDFPNARLPLNHNRICAMSRGPLAQMMWQGGRGIMDDAAAFILQGPEDLPSPETVEDAMEETVAETETQVNGGIQDARR